MDVIHKSNLEYLLRHSIESKSRGISTGKNNKTANTLHTEQPRKKQLTKPFSKFANSTVQWRSSFLFYSFPEDSITKKERKKTMVRLVFSALGESNLGPNFSLLGSGGKMLSPVYIR